MLVWEVYSVDGFDVYRLTFVKNGVEFIATVEYLSEITIECKIEDVIETVFCEHSDDLASAKRCVMNYVTA